MALAETGGGLEEVLAAATVDMRGVVGGSQEGSVEEGIGGVDPDLFRRNIVRIERDLRVSTALSAFPAPERIRAEFARAQSWRWFYRRGLRQKRV